MNDVKSRVSDCCTTRLVLSRDGRSESDDVILQSSEGVAEKEEGLISREKR